MLWSDRIFPKLANSSIVSLKNTKRIKLLVYQKKCFTLKKSKKKILQNNPKFQMFSIAYQVTIPEKNPSILPFWLFSSLVQWTFFAANRRMLRELNCRRLSCPRNVNRLIIRLSHSALHNVSFWELLSSFILNCLHEGLTKIVLIFYQKLVGNC